MSDIALAPDAPVATPIPIRELWPWLVFGGLLALLAIYFVGAEEGATSLISSMASSTHLSTRTTPLTRPP